MSDGVLKSEQDTMATTVFSCIVRSYGWYMQVELTLTLCQCCAAASLRGTGGPCLSNSDDTKRLPTRLKPTNNLHTFVVEEHAAILSQLGYQSQRLTSRWGYALFHSVVSARERP